MRIFKKGPDGKYSDEDIERMIEETVAEQRLEGIILGEAEVARLRDYAFGRITWDEYFGQCLAAAKAGGNA